MKPRSEVEELHLQHKMLQVTDKYRKEKQVRQSVVL